MLALGGKGTIHDTALWTTMSRYLSRRCAIAETNTETTLLNLKNKHGMCLYSNSTPQAAKQLLQHPGSSLTLFLPPIGAGVPKRGGNTKSIGKQMYSKHTQ